MEKYKNRSYVISENEIVDLGEFGVLNIHEILWNINNRADSKFLKSLEKVFPSYITSTKINKEVYYKKHILVPKIIIKKESYKKTFVEHKPGTIFTHIICEDIDNPWKKQKFLKEDLNIAYEIVSKDILSLII